MKTPPLLLVLSLLACSLISKSIAASYTNVSVFEAKNMIDSNPSLIVLDVRTQSEYDTGHIRNALLIPLTELEARLNELDATDEILVYCKSGGRSATASQTLVDNGFLYVYNMLGGITSWTSEGYPTYVKYFSIQEVVNNANEGDQIYVSSGTYYEHVIVNRSVSLNGENRNDTIIDGGSMGTGILVTADHVTVQEFRVQNCEIGIKVESNDSVISSNLVSFNGYNETEFFANQEIAQDYVSPTHRWYLHNMINSSYAAFFNLTEHTPAISVQALGHEDVNQLAIGLFHDENGDHEPQLQEYVGYMDAKEQNVQVFLVNPPVGQYIIKVMGWEVPGDPGHFDLEITRYNGYGIVFLSSSNHIVTQNLATQNPVGLCLYDSYNTTIQLNEATENVGGIAVSDSIWCVISNNKASFNEFGSGKRQFGVGLTFWSVHNSCISENDVSSNLFGIWLFNSSSNDLTRNGLVSNPGWGLLIYTSHTHTVRFNNIFTSGDGIRMMFSCQNNFTENHFESNGHAGIFLWLDNKNNSITGNKFYSNGQHGVELKLSNGNNIADNRILYNGVNGILIVESNGCVVRSNLVFSNPRGIMFYDAFENLIYRNSIIDSFEQPALDGTDGNLWDNGYPDGGNYWSGYEDVDQFSGPYQNETGSDGIWDHPYGVGATNQDYYPLTESPIPLPPIPGDINADHTVDILDAILLANAFGSRPSDSHWNPNADINNDESVDILDAIILAAHYDETWT